MPRHSSTAGGATAGSAPALHPALALRLAVRQLRRAPGATVYAALTLAIGLGAATAIYSVMTGFTAPLPVPDGEQVVQIRVEDPESGQSGATFADLRAWRSESRSLRSLGGFATFTVAVNAAARTPRRVEGADLTAETFALLGVAPLLGRLPAATTADRGAVVVSHQLWQSWLEGDPEVLGKSLRLRDDPHTVVGVLPAGFHFPFHEDLWRVRGDGDGDQGGVEVAARLAAGVSRRRAGEELTAILRSSRTAASGVASTARAEVHGFTEKRGESGERTMLLGLLLLVLALIMVSCSNVSNLLLERAAARARSLSVHQAVGAVPGQVVLQILTEALLVAILGAAAGLAVAYGAVAFVDRTLADHWGYYWMVVRVDPPALAFAGLLAVVTALVSGTLPAWRAMRADIAEPLKQETRSGRRRGRSWASWSLMTGQVAFSAAAVIASLLMGLGLLESRRVEDGFPADSLTWASLTLDGDRYAEAGNRRGFRDRLLAELDSQGAVRAAALSSGMPGLRSSFRRVTFDGAPPGEGTRPVPVSGVTPAFFEVFGLRVLEGRGFRDTEEPDAVAVVSEDFVRRRFADGSAVGRTLRLYDAGSAAAGSEALDVRIVGVVSDVVIYARDRGRRLDHVYLPVALDDIDQLYLTVASASPRSEVAAAVARAAHTADPDVPFGALRSISEMLAYVRQFMETLGTLAILGGLGAMMVVTIGLYGLISFDVRRRLPELAVRLALGAGSGRVFAGVLRQGIFLILPGVVLGLGLTWLATPLLGVFLGGVDAHDPRVFAGALAVYGLIAVLAAGSPARRAALCNPVDVLRSE